MDASPPPTPVVLPGAGGDWLAWVRKRVRSDLVDAAAHLAALRDLSPGDVAALQLWNDVGIALANAASVSSLMSVVHPDPAVMEAAEACEIEVRTFTSDLHLDTRAHARLAALKTEPLDADAARVLSDALRSFRRAGVDRDDGARAQLRDLNLRESRLTQDFGRGIRDGKRTTRVPAAALAGLPEDWRADHPADAGGEVEISTDYPDTMPFLTHARDPAARRMVAGAFLDVGWPGNDAVLADLLDARERKARLLGYHDWPSYDAEVTMIGQGARIPDFIDSVSAAARDAGLREIEQLLVHARAEGEEVIDFSNWRHHLETLKRERFGLDAQEVLRYFDADKVRTGVLEVTGRLLGLAWTPVDAEAWHSEVLSYDVTLVENGQWLGRIHLDLHPRARKFNHAAQFVLVPGVLDRQLPEGVLVCNFARGPMPHEDVVTLFHEFGHLLHHVLAGRHPWVRFSGVATERDFVEAPSQLLEEWAWDASVLRGFATDAGGVPVPEDLVERLRAANEFGKAFLARTQMAYAAISYWLHQERPADLTAELEDLVWRYSLVAPLPGTHFHAGFGHLEDYTSSYYTYMWSLVIAKDLFSAFDPVDLFDPEVARRYRDTVLAPGGSRDAADLVEAFLGRPYDQRAFDHWLETTPQEPG